MSSAPSDVYGVFTNADFPFPTVTLADGTTRKLDLATFSVSRSLPNREDRKKVFDAFFGALGDYRGTIGTALNAEVQKDLFYMRARKYPTTLDAALDPDTIPTSVYTKLIDGVNANLPTFHRYLNLRKRMLGLDDLHYYDLYAPLVANAKLDYSLDETKKNILGALAPLGTGYTSVIERAFNDRWIDLYPNAGKRTGAYSNGGAYDVHPYMLINYNGRYDDMSTVAHELGHTMQSYFSNKNQPYPTAGYPIFVAEVASTFNEALLNDYMLKQIKDPATRLSLLGNYLEGMKGTVFRQTQFAEFELRIHEVAEKGEPLTGDSFDKIYLDIVKRYYGHDKGVCIVDDVVEPGMKHLFRQTQFAEFELRIHQAAEKGEPLTGDIVRHDVPRHREALLRRRQRRVQGRRRGEARVGVHPALLPDVLRLSVRDVGDRSAALSEKVMSGDANATKRYLAFLSAGGSKYPIDLLKDAGVDMTTSEPLDLTMKKMNRVMDEMDAILKQMGK